MSRHYLDPLLSDVDLSGRSAVRFEPLTRALGERWGLAPELIGAKALADQKNWGNRVAEATRVGIERLVLLSGSEIDPAALGRAFAAHALTAVPTLLAVRREKGWVPCAVLLAEGVENPFEPDLPITRVVLDGPPPLDEGVLASLRERIVSLAGRPSDTDVASLLADEDLDNRALVVKRVADSANLGNRVGEAIGRRPAAFVLSVPALLAESARRSVADQLARTSDTHAAYLAIETADGLAIEPVSPVQGDLIDAANGAEKDWQLSEKENENEVENKKELALPLEYLRLDRVSRLHHHLPLGSNADQLYEEHRQSTERLSYPTPTLKYLKRLLCAPERAFVVLTGDAGHGKTYLCRRLLEGTGGNVDVMAMLAADRVGDSEHEVDGASRPVRVVKDLSDVGLPEESAAPLERLLLQDESHVIVCANEGRLRDVVGYRSETLAPLLKTLERGIETGQTSLSAHPTVHVINLNHQAATAGEGGFLAYALGHFLDNEKAWRKCTRCAASPDCPILANRRDLAARSRRRSGDGLGRDALIEAVRVVEEGGHVLTFRETLAFVAYAVTGTLDCESVERLHREAGDADGLRRARLPDVLFEPRFSFDEDRVLPLLGRLRRLDPGRIASRPVDERVHESLEQSDAFGSGLFDDASGQPTTRAELEVERLAHLDLVRRARRAAWFVSAPEEEGVRRVQRLGLRHHHVFRKLLGEPEATFLDEAVRKVARGLHSIQGAIGIETKRLLHLVDPAFGRSGNPSAIVARSLRQQSLELVSESRWWRERHGAGDESLLESVEWIDRRLLLVLREGEPRPLLSLDMLGFEFVADAASGVVMRDFHSAARRRVLATLARVAEAGDRTNEEIRVLVGQGEEALTVARDGRIHLEGGS